mgnify:CR=1 FL=1
MLYIFGTKLHVYLDAEDDHREYIARTSMDYYADKETNKLRIGAIVNDFLNMRNDGLNVFSVTDNVVGKTVYEQFEKTIGQL